MKGATMAENSNTQSNGDRKALTTVSTKTHGVDAIPMETVGTLDGVTVGGQAVTVRLRGKSVDTVRIGKEGQVYVENKPVPEIGSFTADNFPGPVVKIGGKAKKATRHVAGKFSGSVDGPNSMPRSITAVNLTDATVTLTTGETVTLEGKYTLLAVVKFDHKTDSGRIYRRTVVAKGHGVEIATLNK